MSFLRWPPPRDSAARPATALAAPLRERNDDPNPPALAAPLRERNGGSAEGTTAARAPPLPAVPEAARAALPRTRRGRTAPAQCREGLAPPGGGAGGGASPQRGREIRRSVLGRSIHVRAVRVLLYKRLNLFFLLPAGRQSLFFVMCSHAPPHLKL